MNFLFFIVILFSPLHAQENLSQDFIETPQTREVGLPDPYNLDDDWQDFFSNQATLQNHIDQFTKVLDAISKKQESQQEILSIVAAIKQLLLSMQQKDQQEGTSLEIHITHEESYSVKNFIELHANLVLAKKFLDEQKDLLVEEKRRKKELQVFIDSLWKSYKSTPLQSNERLLKGLQIIMYQFSLNSSAAFIKQATASLNHTLETIQALQRELDRATRTLTSNEIEVQMFQDQAIKAKKAWLDAQAFLRQKEIYQIQPLIKDSESLTLDQIAFAIELTNLHIDEAFARITYEFFEQLVFLSQYIMHPENVDYENKEDALRIVHEDILAIVDTSSNWLARTQNSLAHSSNALFLLTDQEAHHEAITMHKKIISFCQENLILLQELEQRILDTQFVNNFLFTLLKKEKNFVNKVWQDTLWNFQGTIDTLSYYYNITLFHIGNSPVTLKELTEAFIVFIIAYFIAHALRKVSRRVLSKTMHTQAHIIYRVDRIIQYIVLTTGFLLALSFVGFDLTNLAIIAGALGVGLGFGLQSIFNNFVCGLIILFENQIKVGDFVQLDDELEGEIKEIKTHNTVLESYDGIEIIIPNADLLNNRLINWTLSNPLRRDHIPFSVDYGTDTERVKQIVLQVADSLPHTLKLPHIPPPEVWLVQFGNYGLQMELIVWTSVLDVEQQKACISYYLWEIEKALRAAGIGIPSALKEFCIISTDQPSSIKKNTS